MHVPSILGAFLAALWIAWEPLTKLIKSCLETYKGWLEVQEAKAKRQKAEIETKQMERDEKLKLAKKRIDEARQKYRTKSPVPMPFEEPFLIGELTDVEPDLIHQALLADERDNRPRESQIHWPGSGRGAWG